MHHIHSFFQQRAAGKETERGRKQYKKSVFIVSDPSLPGSFPGSEVLQMPVFKIISINPYPTCSSVEEILSLQV